MFVIRNKKTGVIMLKDNKPMKFYTSKDAIYYLECILGLDVTLYSVECVECIE